MEEYEEYLEAFCKQYSMSRGIAEQQAIVKEVKAYYESRSKCTIGEERNERKDSRANKG